MPLSAAVNRTASSVDPITGRAKVARPHVPSTAEMQRRLVEMLPGLHVYNPTNRWLQPEVHGITNRWLCPDLGGAIDAHPITGLPVVCDGITEIRGRTPVFTSGPHAGEPQTDSSGKVITGQDAASVVSFMTGSEQWGQLGIVFLPGENKEEDEELKRFARQVWVDFQRKADDDIIARRMEFKANWEKNPACRGQSCPPPTPIETDAIERQQLRVHERTFLYTCPIQDCPGFAVNDWGRFQGHMRAAHQVEAKREQFEAPSPTSTEGHFGPVVTDDPNTSDIAQEVVRRSMEKTAEKLGVTATPATSDDDDDDDDVPAPPPSPTASSSKRGGRR